MKFECIVVCENNSKSSFLMQHRAKRKAKISSIHGNLKKKTCLPVYLSGSDTPRH